MRTNDSCFLSVINLSVIDDELVIYLFRVLEKGNTEILIFITNVTEKLIFIECDENSYVCKLPQSIEIQLS